MNFLVHISVFLLLIFSSLAKGDGGEYHRNYVNVKYITVNSNVSEGWCRMMRSAAMTGLDIVSLGYQEQYSHLSRWDKILTYVKSLELRLRDVVVLFDGRDIFFSGADPEHYINAFIESSPPDEHHMDPMAIHRGYFADGSPAQPPVIFSGESNCMMRQITSQRTAISFYNSIELALSSVDPNYVSNNKGALNRYRFLNAGGMIARVWALKKLHRAFKEFVAERVSLKHPWFCDQSIFAAFYLRQQRRLVQWLWNPNSTAPDNYQLPLGMIGVEPFGAFVFAPFHGVLGKDFCETSQMPPMKPNSAQTKFHDAFRVNSTHLTVCKRPIFKVKNQTSPIFPLALHFPGRGKKKLMAFSFTKYLPWESDDPVHKAWIALEIQNKNIELRNQTSTWTVPLRKVCQAYFA